MPKTLPTPLSIESDVGAPPESVQLKVAVWPETKLSVGFIVKELITGAVATGFTVTVTCFVAVPPLFEAVSV